MKRYSDYRQVGDLRTAVTIGNFDGVHTGHMALLGRTCALAKTRRALATVLTFDPHPVRVLAPTLAPPLIVTPKEKRRLLAAQGVEVLLEQRFDETFAALAPEAFVREVLHRALGAFAVVVGYDFTFGRARAGDTELLERMGRQLGFETQIVCAQSVAPGVVASSSKVREFVLAGQMEGAALVLGRLFSILGHVVEGARRGRRLGFPTANVANSQELLPRVGVYAGWLDWSEGPRPAVINVGYSPTFGPSAGSPLVEAHVLGAEGLALYGRACRLHFARRLRDERRFDGAEALVAQIRADAEQAAAFLSENGSPEPAPVDWPEDDALPPDAQLGRAPTR